MARDATTESQLAKERLVGLEYPVGVPNKSECPINTPNQGIGTRRETLYQQADNEGEDPIWEEIETTWQEDLKQLF